MENFNNVPKLRFPEFSGGWEKRTLGGISEIKTGNKDTQNKVENGLYPFFVRSNTIERINSYSFDGESILTSGDGVGVGKNFHYINGKFDFHQRVYSIRNFEKDINGKFVYFVFSDQFYDRVNRISAKNSVDSIRMDMISDMELQFPTYAEQTKISTFLTIVDERISLLKKKLGFLVEFKKGIQQKLFSQELRFVNENGNDFPEWEEKGGNYMFESISDKNHNSDLPILAITQEFGAIPRDLIDYNVTVTDKSVEGYKVVQIGDFIISLRSFQGGIEYSSYKGICSPAYIILRPIIEIDDRFYKYFFKTDFYIKLLNKNLEGIRDGKMISFKYFSEISLPYPSLLEQTKIANFLSAIDDKIAQTTLQIEKMQLWEKGLLQQLFC